MTNSSPVKGLGSTRSSVSDAPCLLFPFADCCCCRGLSHYAGGVFSGSPLMLAAVALCAMLPAAVQTLAAAFLFAGVDLASALLLRAICVRAVAVESGDW